MAKQPKSQTRSPSLSTLLIANDKGRRSTRLAPMVNVSLTEATSVMDLDFENGFSYADLKSACDFSGHRHIYAVVTYLSRYLMKSDSAKILALIEVVHTHFDGQRSREEARKNMGSASIHASRCDALQSIALGNFKWEVAKTEKSETNAPKFGISSGQSFLDRLKAPKAPKAPEGDDKADDKAPKAPEAPKADDKADDQKLDVVALMAEITKLKSSKLQEAAMKKFGLL